MNKLIILFSDCLFLFCCHNPQPKEQCLLIETPVPERPTGQTDVLKLATEPIPTVRIAFTGYSGMASSYILAQC